MLFYGDGGVEMSVGDDGFDEGIGDIDGFEEVVGGEILVVVVVVG